MPELAKTIRVERHHRTCRILVDGEELPWYVAPGVTAAVDRDDVPSVTVTIPAERVEVVDDTAANDLKP